MVDYCCEAYEDNAGRLLIVALEETGKELRPVWGATYYGREDEAAQDWAGLVVQGLDPLREGWEGIEPDRIAELYHESTARMIAGDDWDGDDYPLGIDLDRCGEAGRLFAIAAGAAYRCPECGEVCQTVRDVIYPGSWAVPRCCECCGASLTDCEL